MKLHFACSFLSLFSVLPLAAQNPVWGSFDLARINYSGGTLNGSAHSTLQSIITANGGVIAAPTPTLTSAYLSDKTVFYTSLLNTNTGTLSMGEQAALQNWISNGGTLIVTGDSFPLQAYEAFTSFYGVTNWTSISNTGSGNAVASHAVTLGVNRFQFTTNGTYTYGNDALLLADDGSGTDYCIVMEPATGFTAGGRILVFGDHNMFTDSYITRLDTRRLATNTVLWAHLPPVCTGSPASWNNYGTGWAGGSGVPSITLSGNPILGGSVSMTVQNSSGAASTGLLLFGAQSAMTPTPVGGTLLLTPTSIVDVAVPVAGLTLPFTLSASPLFCGISIYVQSVQIDPAASLGVSFTPGLQMVLGS